MAERTKARRARRETHEDAAEGLRGRKEAAIKQRIVTAALALFQSKGFSATTTKAIALKAGIAEGTVFNYFPTKEDIALYFFEQEVDHAITTVRQSPRMRSASLEEKLFALIQSQLEYLAPYERFIGTAFVEALRPTSKLGAFSHKAQALRHRYMSFVQELFEESLPKRKHHVQLSWWLPDAFWIYYLGALLFWLLDSSPRKQNTLAFLDGTLRAGIALVERTS